MLSPYLSLIALIGAPRSDAASGFPPGRGWRFSNNIFGPGRSPPILPMLSPYPPIGASRSDAAPSFPPGHSWRFSNDIFGPGRSPPILPMLSPYLLLEFRAPTPYRAFLPVAAGGFLTEFAKSVQQSCAILVLFLMKSTPLRQLRYLRYLWHALSSLCKENMSSPAPTGEKALAQRRSAAFLPL